MTVQDWQETPPVITDGSITLRVWQKADAPAVLAACQDLDIQHWLPIQVPYLEEHARAFVTDFAAQEWSSGQGAPFAVIDASTDELLGSASLKDIDLDARVSEGGYWVAPWARGRNVALRAMRLLCGWALTDLDLERVQFVVDPTNRASRSVLDHLGAAWEGLLPDAEVIHGTSRETALYSLTRENLTA
jgi:RimJ/RimL family protein N-acetyltransferase